MRYGPRDKDDLRPLYKTLAQKYRVLIYSGDVDMCVPYVGTEEWTRDLGFPTVSAWRPWAAGTTSTPNATTTAGYFTTYDASAAADASHNFTFLTIKVLFIDRTRYTLYTVLTSLHSLLHPPHGQGRWTYGA
jgi:hypothetical protein